MFEKDKCMKELVEGAKKKKKKITTYSVEYRVNEW